MNSTLLFPKHHVMTPHDMVRRALFVAHYATLAGIEVKMVENTNTVWMNRKVPGQGWVPSNGNLLSCEYNGQQIIFEFSDFPELGMDWIEPYSHLPVFKFHYKRQIHDELDNVFPIGPCMILPSGIEGFNQYYSLRDTFQYTCSTDLISNRQEPRRLAQERRTKVQRMLQTKYGINVDINWQGTQTAYWESNEHVLASVCVPGACNNMLDRGHYELLGLGVCTISPNIPTLMPWNNRLIEDYHYAQCKNDYTDLIRIIEWNRGHREDAIEIGNNARAFFDDCCTPTKYWGWIDECIGE